MPTVTIAGRTIGPGHPPYVIAELGAMYEDLDGMKRLLSECAKAGVDAVKLQTYRAETLALPGAEFEFEDGSRMSQMEFFKRYEISEADHRALFAHAEAEGIAIFSTPSHYEDVDFLMELGVPALKTGSDDLTNYPFLDYIARQGKPMIVSTGMATMEEIERAVSTILATGNDQLILLHCTVSYPPEPRFANLEVMKTLRSAFGLVTGYSDHVFGVFSSVLAAADGADVVEKHVTLDRALKRADYQVALEPAELADMVRQIRLIPELRGSSVKTVTEPERKWRLNARKSLVAVRDMPAGHVLSADDIKIMRPGTGVHPKHAEFFIGRALVRDVAANEQLKRDAV